MNQTIQTIEGIRDVVASQLPAFWQPFVILAFYTAILAVYIIFIWKFYHFLAKRNILELNLNRYNRTEHPVWYKVWASLLYLLEYAILLPILVFFWFGILALFLLFLSKTQSINHILLISTAIIAATRMASYYKEGAAQELAKIFPLSLLAVFISEPNFFSIGQLVERFFSIPSFFNHILIYLVFIAAIEIVLRSAYLFIDFVTSEEEREVGEKTG